MKNVVKNNIFLWKLCFKAAPGYMMYFVFDAFRYQFSIFLEHVLGIRYVLWCAEYGEPFENVLFWIGMLMLLLMILMIPDGYYIHGLTFRKKPLIYKALKEKMYEKAAELDLSCYDDPVYYNDFVLAVAESEKCIDRFLEMLNVSIQSLTIIFSTGVLYLLTDVAGILFVAASFVLGFLFSKLLNRLNVAVRTKINPLERKQNYSARVFYLNDYAKELRLNKKIGRILKEEFNEATSEIMEEQRRVSKKRVGLMFLTRFVASDFITDGLYITYLVFQAAVFHKIDYSTAVILFGRIGQLKHGFNGLAGLPPKANENSLYIDKIMKFLEYKPSVTSDNKLSVPYGTGELELCNVSFRYKSDAEDILRGISLKVKPGERIAIVGYNGAGKTTLIKLLMRLYDPTKGSIHYHGRDIREYDMSAYHNRIGVVFQDYRMFAESLAENVILDDTEIDEAIEQKVTKVLASSNFSDRLATLPDGLDTQITTEFDEKGVNLSGGESQKVAIARAFYRDADILVMDEPSSALDPITEYNLNKSMHEAAENKTVFYISHRLSTTRDADRIIMLEKGCIIEEGTHEELLRRNGKYAAMWNAQAGKYMAAG